MENPEKTMENPPANPKKSSFGLGQIIGLIGAILLIVGAFLPWGRTAIVDVTGLDGDGVITLGIGVVAIILLLIKKVPLWITIILGVVALAIGIIDMRGMAAANTELGLEAGDEFAVSIGSGLYLTVVGGVGLIVGPIVGYIMRKK